MAAAFFSLWFGGVGYFLLKKTAPELDEDFERPRASPPLLRAEPRTGAVDGFGFSAVVAYRSEERNVDKDSGSEMGRDGPSSHPRDTSADD